MTISSYTKIEQDTIQRNTQMFREAITAIRKEDDKGFKELLMSPKNLHPDVKDNDVAFQVNVSKEPYTPVSIYAKLSQLDQSKKKMTGVVVMDYYPENTFTHVMQSSEIASLSKKIRLFQTEIEQMYGRLPKNEQMDTYIQQSFMSSMKMLQESDQNIRKRGDPYFNQKDDKVLANLLLGHELTHLSFKDNHLVKFEYMDKAIVPQDAQGKRHLSNALMNLNRYIDGQQLQAEGANYRSTRDEIMADVGGIYAATFIGLKHSMYTEEQLRTTLKKVQWARLNNNEASSIHNMSSHNTAIAFDDKYLDKIIALAKTSLRKPNTNVYQACLDITEDVFFDTMKQTGIIMKRSFQVNNQLGTAIKNGTSGLNISSVYERQMNTSNAISAQTFEKCQQNNRYTAGPNLCINALNGAQRQAVDKNNDHLIDGTTNVARALKESVSNGTITGIPSNGTALDIEKAITKKEGEALAKFAKDNLIEVTTTNQLGANIIELNKTGAALKFK